MNEVSSFVFLKKIISIFFIVKKNDLDLSKYQIYFVVYRKSGF